jgi:hypothetical protein
MWFQVSRGSFLSSHFDIGNKRVEITEMAISRRHQKIL